MNSLPDDVSGCFGIDGFQVFSNVFWSLDVGGCFWRLFSNFSSKRPIVLFSIPAEFRRSRTTVNSRTTQITDDECIGIITISKTYF